MTATNDLVARLLHAHLFLAQHPNIAADCAEAAALISAKDAEIATWERDYARNDDYLRDALATAEAERDAATSANSQMHSDILRLQSERGEARHVAEAAWAERDAAQSALEAAQKVCDAALVWAFCPADGAYLDGPADAVNEWLGIDEPTPPYERWTVETMRERIAALASAAGKP